METSLVSKTKSDITKVDAKEFNINEFQIGQNLYIDASAGTGKTYTIQQIVAKMVGAGIKLPSILIVTYTDKAAGELRDRIRQVIEDRVVETGYDCYREALQEINNAPIFTIHSFCKNTLKSLAYEAKATMAMDIVDDGEVEALIDKIIRDDWARDDGFKKLYLENNIKITDLKNNCINAVNQYGLADNVILNKNQYKNFNSILELVADVAKYWQILKANETVVASNKKQIKELVSSIEKWGGSGKLFDGRKLRRDTWTKEGIWPNDETSKAVLFFFDLKDGHDFGEESIFDEDLFIFENLVDIVNRWDDYKHENKLQSYNDMIKSVHDEVCNESDSALVNRLRETYRYAIIDEFQDTNQRQWDIFKKVFLESPLIEGKAQNNIIVVGDPKQSIYAFQGADLEVYRNAISEIGVENGRRLSTNNRSSDALIEACNHLFEEGFFENGSDFLPSDCPPLERKKMPATLYGKVIEPLWISEDLNNYDFAKYAVLKILECCKRTEDGKTALQIYDKNLKRLRDVVFSDFAILGRTRSELAVMETVLAQAGIPFARYKDANLFQGKEAWDWIALLSAINAPDFSAYNRKYLNCALISDFFRVSLLDCEKEEYSNPIKSPMKEIIYWRILASKRQWSELQEKIYSDTEIDKKLNTPTTLQSLAKLRQIGAYVFDYLYNHKVSIEEVIKHLEGLSASTEDVDEADDNLVARGSDFQAVRIMTSHASKGLAFPIVIAIGGMKDYYDRMSGPYLYRKDNKKYLGFDKASKRAKKAEDLQEFRRLMYVAYTRAESLMILPRYDAKPAAFEFLNKALDRVQKLSETKAGLVRKDKVFDSSNWNWTIVKDFVKSLLNGLKIGKSDSDVDSALARISSLQSVIDKLKLYLVSYSSITEKKKAIENGKESETVSDLDISLPEGRLDKEEGSDGQESTEESETVIVDNMAQAVLPCGNYEAGMMVPMLTNYPRGSRLGNALHSAWEKIDFSAFGGISSETDAKMNIFARGSVEEAFHSQSLPIGENPDWLDYTVGLFWHTLNSNLPEIHGNKSTGNSFCLKSLTDKCKKSEMEFRLDVRDEKWMNCFWKGFVDLIFVRQDEDGNEYYSILDWKSDVLENDVYGNFPGLADKVKRNYSIQVVLYSYTLILWLKQFYPELGEEEIFEKHFGGIYYVFVRGCYENTSNGIYAQTWSCFSALKESYENILKLMRM